MKAPSTLVKFGTIGLFVVLIAGLVAWQSGWIGSQSTPSASLADGGGNQAIVDSDSVARLAPEFDADREVFIGGSKSGDWSMQPAVAEEKVDSPVKRIGIIQSTKSGKVFSPPDTPAKKQNEKPVDPMQLIYSTKSAYVFLPPDTPVKKGIPIENNAEPEKELMRSRALMPVIRPEWQMFLDTTRNDSFWRAFWKKHRLPLDSHTLKTVPPQEKPYMGGTKSMPVMRPPAPKQEIQNNQAPK